MAFSVQQINPLDLQPRKAVGVSIPFSNRAVFNSTYTTQDAIKSNLINYCLTNRGERFLNPDFGADITRLLFEPATQGISDEVEAVIRSGILTWFPNVVIEDLKVTTTIDTNTATVYLKYNIRNTNIQDQLVINFEQ